ncbi:Tetratricopeptide repeat-containing protein OS=Streptomyces microflavus OX=1919 GN=Smic_58880 PE=4 SV=1 [Streptomyces microflavus]
MHPDHTAPTSTPPPAPSRGGRRLRSIAVTLALGAAMFAAGAVLLTPDDSAAPRPAGHGQPAGATRGPIEALQARVARLPKDPGGWAALGMAYVQQARTTADPATYDRAEQALRTSLSVQSEDNTDAETAMGALAAAHHDFPAALRWARKATTSGPYSSSAHGVLADAYTQLGRYGEADEAVQKMVDLRPDAASLARASYTFELKGDTDRARALMRRSLAAAATPADASGTRPHRPGIPGPPGRRPPGSPGRSAGAGFRAAPDDPALLETRARAHLARGDTTRAVADYRAAVAIAPLPHHLLGLGELEQSLGNGKQAEEVVRPPTRPGPHPGSRWRPGGHRRDPLRSRSRQPEKSRHPGRTDPAHPPLRRRSRRLRLGPAPSGPGCPRSPRPGRRSPGPGHPQRALPLPPCTSTKPSAIPGRPRDLTEALREPGFHPLHADAARDLLQRIDTTP